MKRVALNKVAKVDRTAASAEQCQVLPYVGLEHIEKDTGHFSSEFTPLPEKLRATKYYFSQKHVLYSKLRPYLNKVVLPDFDGVCTTEIMPILPDENKLDRTFLWAYLLTPEFTDWASQIVSGANLPRLSPKDLAKHPIPLPPLEEQRRIAGILARADRLRQMRRYALQLSDGYLQSVFLRMFGDPMTNPMDLPIVKFGDVCESRLGKMLDQKQQTGQHLRPYLRNVNVQWGQIDLSDLQEMDFNETDREKFRLRKGDVLICEGGEVGRSAIWKDELEECYYQKALHRARPDPELALPEFILWLMYSLANLGGLGDFTSQVTIAHLTGVKLKTIEFPLPPLEEQKKFAEICGQFRRLQNQQREALRQADHLFDTLLHRAFSGAL
jgi:type I restriction enzyme, S subunit